MTADRAPASPATAIGARGPRRDLPEPSRGEPKLEPCYAVFGRWVRRQRLRHDLTQTQLAARIGATREWLAGVEGGYQRVLLHQVIVLVRVLGDPPPVAAGCLG